MHTCLYKMCVHIQLLILEMDEHNFRHCMSLWKIRFYLYIIYTLKAVASPLCCPE